MCKDWNGGLDGMTARFADGATPHGFALPSAGLPTQNQPTTRLFARHAEGAIRCGLFCIGLRSSAMTWKNTERKIARLLNGRRIPVSGRAGQPDIDHPFLAIEVKSRKQLPRWLLDAIHQAVRSAHGRTPVVVLHEWRRPHNDDIVLLRLSDFLALLSTLRVTPVDHHAWSAGQPAGSQGNEIEGGLTSHKESPTIGPGSR